MGTVEVGIERGKSDVHTVIPVVNEARGVMCHENIDPRKLRQRVVDIHLLEEEIAHWFVAPRPAESAEGHSANLIDLLVQVDDRRGK